MTRETDNYIPKASALSKFTALTIVILLCVVTMVIVSLFLYINVIRSPEMMSDNLLTRNFFGSPLLVLDVLYIGVSLVFIVLFLFVVFRRKTNSTADRRSIYVDPVSSEVIEEKDLFLHRDKTVTDTSRKSILLDGENRFTGNGGFRGMTGGGFGGGYFGHEDKFDSDGDRE